MEGLNLGLWDLCKTSHGGDRSLSCFSWIFSFVGWWRDEISPLCTYSASFMDWRFWGTCRTCCGRTVEGWCCWRLVRRRPKWVIKRGKGIMWYGVNTLDVGRDFLAEFGEKVVTIDSFINYCLVNQFINKPLTALGYYLIHIHLTPLPFLAKVYFSIYLHRVNHW